MAPVTRPEHRRIVFTGFHRCSWSHDPAARIVDYRKDSGTNRAQASVRRRCASEFSSRPAIALRDSPHRAAMRSRDRSRAPVDVNSSMVRATWLSLRQSSSKMAIRSAYPPYLPQTEHQPTALCVCLLECLRQRVSRYCGLIRRHPTGHRPVGTPVRAAGLRPTRNAWLIRALSCGQQCKQQWGDGGVTGCLPAEYVQ